MKIRALARALRAPQSCAVSWSAFVRARASRGVELRPCNNGHAIFVTYRIYRS
ncbi:MAG: hypothetical protein LBC77_01860 [Spirochaetaceae bacterium]|nr:hypothetical protein [Spirochaetaceae bacterium]